MPALRWSSPVSGVSAIKTLFRAFYALALILGAGACFLFGRQGFETDLYSLLGDRADADGVVSALAQAQSDSIRVLCTDSNRAERCRAVCEFDPSPDTDAMLELLRTHGKGLLSTRDREMLETFQTNRIVRSAMRRDYSGMGILPKADDPYYLLNDFLLEFKTFVPELPNGSVLLTGVASDRKSIANLVALAQADDGIALSGPGFHSYLATASTKREINLLGGISLAAVFLLGFVLFRGVRFIIPTFLALLCGFVIGTAVVLVLPGRPHVLTFLFGTSLVGLGVDYCYHSLAPRGPRFARDLTSAFITTALSFVPLMFSSVAVLNQMAAFTVSGLAAIYAYAMLFIRPSASPAADSPRKIRLPSLWLKLALLAILAFGATRVELRSDVSRFHRPCPLMARGEKAVAEATGFGEMKFRTIPLLEWQQRNAELKTRLGFEPQGEFLTAADLPRAMTFVAADGREMLLLPAHAGAADVVDPAKSLADMFAALAHESYILFGISIAVLAVTMLLVFRLGAFIRLVSVVGAIVLSACSLGLLGEPIDFFKVICFFVLAGLGVDYAIFHRGDGADDGVRARTVFFSFLTSLIGLGMLYFTSFQVTRSMGMTFAIGLIFSYLLSLPGTARCKDGDEWHRQRERSAGRLRLAFMWWLYRVAGKVPVKVVCVLVVACAYPFARPVRRNIARNLKLAGLPAISPFLVMLSFAWSLVDKIDACTLCRHPPKFRLRGDAGWMKGGAFLLCSHLGCIETLPAFRNGNEIMVHAFQQLGHDAIFTSMFLKHLDPRRLTLHAVESIGVETAVEMKEAIARGEIVIMAGDRMSAGSKATVKFPFFSHDVRWPKGVFRFAALMNAPVYAIVAVREGGEYVISAKEIKGDLVFSYVKFLEEEIRRNPREWFQFFDIFS